MKATYILLAMLMSCTIAHAQLPTRIQKKEVYERYSRTDTFSHWATAMYRYGVNNKTINPDTLDLFSRGGVNKPLVKEGQMVYSYDSQGRLLSEVSFVGSTAANMVVDAKVLYFYGTSGLQDSVAYLVAGNTSSQLYLKRSIRRYYNGNGQVTKVLTQEDITDKGDIVYQERFVVYNANGTVASDSFFSSYSYSSSTNSSMQKHTYNSKGLLIATDAVEYYNSTNAIPLFKSAYHYSANDSLIVDSTLHQYDGRSTYNGKKENYYYRKNSGMLQHAESRSITNYGSATPLVEYEVLSYYNASGDIDYEISLQEYTPGNIYDDSTQYYYTNSPGGDNGGSNNNNSSITAYPIPGGNVLNMQWTSNGVAKVVVRIADAYGKIVKQWTDEANGVYYKTIDVSSLQNGHYYIILDAEGKRAIKHISVQR